MFRPRRVHQIGKDIREPVGVAGKTSARLIEHRPGIVLQSNVRFGERVQDLLGEGGGFASKVRRRDQVVGVLPEHLLGRVAEEAAEGRVHELIGPGGPL